MRIPDHSNCEAQIVSAFREGVEEVGLPSGSDAIEIEVHAGGVEPAPKKLGGWELPPHSVICAHGVWFHLIPSDAQIARWEADAPR